MLITLLIFLLLSNAVTIRQDKSILFSRTVTKSLLFVTYLVWNNLYVNPLEKGIGIYGGLFHVTTFTQAFNIFILLISVIILTLNAFYPRKIYTKSFSSIFQLYKYKLLYNKQEISNTNAEQFRIIEYPLIIVFIICGALFLISTNDLISIFLSIELQSYGLYILSTLYRDSEYATASGLTYFLLGGLSSCFILLGSALLYVNSGTTNLENIYVIASLSEISMYTSGWENIWYQPYYLYLSLIVMSVGFLFKVSAAPFHFWSPDVYDGIPTIVTTYVAIVAKISIFAFLLEFVHYTEYSIFGFSWKSVLLLSSFISLIVGSVLGLTQFRIKRLFAYSTINHVGFILLALSVNTAESIQAFIFYILQYTLSNLNAFMILVTIGFSFYGFVHKVGSKNINSELRDRKNSPVQLISQIKGYFSLNPFIAISLAITLFSFAGIPPLIGFFGKQMILSAALDNGYVFMSLVAILTSVISAAYYLNLIKEVFFFNSSFTKNLTTKIKTYLVPLSQKSIEYKQIENVNASNIVLSSSLASVVSVITLLLTLFIYIPEEWFNIVSILSLIIFKS
jgi:NADH-ubiquinone oxidoreductase chain 2